MSTTNSKQPSLLQLMKRMMGLMWHLRTIEIKAIITGTIGYLAVPALVVAASVSVITALQGSTMWIAWAILAVVCAATRGLFAYLEQYYNHLMAFTILRDIRNTLFAHLRTLAPARLKEQGRGNMVAVLTDDIELLEIFYAHTMSPLSIAALTSIISSAVAAFVHPLLGVCVLVTYIILGVIIPLAVAHPTQRVALRERTLQGNLYSRMLEALDAHQQLTFTSSLSHVQERTTATSRKLLRLRQSRYSLAGMNTIILDLASLLCIIAVGALSLALISAHELTMINATLTVAAYASNLTAISAVTRLGTGLQPTLAAARRVFSLLDTQPYVRDIEETQPTAQAQTTAQAQPISQVQQPTEAQTQPVDAQTTIPANSVDLNVQHIDAGYDTNPHILHNLSMHAKPGTITTITGPNGGGKSTFINACMRFIPLHSGTIELNSKSTEQIPTQQLRQLETLVTQDSYIFSDTLEANLTIANPQATAEDIDNALEAACLTELVQSWPEGTKHVLIRGGVELSDGQRQRISLARAYLSKAPVMFLDEPTANMDTLLEARIVNNLHQQHSSDSTRSCVIISHRTAVTRIADQQYTLDNGALVLQSERER